jgi:hypothetical protein
MGKGRMRQDSSAQPCELSLHLVLSIALFHLKLSTAFYRVPPIWASQPPTNPALTLTAVKSADDKTTSVEQRKVPTLGLVYSLVINSSIHEFPTDKRGMEPQTTVKKHVQPRTGRSKMFVPYKDFICYYSPYFEAAFNTDLIA